MQLRCEKQDLFGKIRYICKCPDCNNVLVIDGDVFNRDSSIVYCYHCKITYNVVSIERKNGLTLKVNKD